MKRRLNQKKTKNKCKTKQYHPITGDSVLQFHPVEREMPGTITDAK